MKPKQIILIDNQAKIIEDILSDSTFSIAVMVVYKEKNKEKYLGNHRVKKIYTMAELNAMDCVGRLDHQTIKTFKQTQLKVENCLNRQSNDYQLRKYVYYSALSFWLTIFDTFSIDMVLIYGLTHGYPHDSIPSDIAVQRGIPSYNIENCTPVKRVLYDNLKACFVPLATVSGTSVDSMVYYASEKSQTRNDIVLARHAHTKKRFLYKLLQIGLKFFGVYPYRIYEDIRRGSFFTIGNYGERFKYSIFSEILSALKAKKHKKYLATLEEGPRAGEKYIFFALHMEPEANITTRAVLDSQLTIIMLLSDCLPEGWLLYVKEHPQQHDLQSTSFYEKVYQSEYYRTKFFYDTISKIKNVRIIQSHLGSKSIIANALAVATLAGTAAWEAVACVKPCFVFVERTPLRLLEDIFFVDSYQSCLRFMEDLAQGYSPRYSDLENTISQYTADNTPEGRKVIIQTLQCLSC